MHVRIVEGGRAGSDADGGEFAAGRACAHLRLADSAERAAPSDLVRCVCQACGSHVHAVVLKQIVSGICGTCGACDLAPLSAEDENWSFAGLERRPTTSDNGEVVVVLIGTLGAVSVDVLEREVRNLSHAGCDRLVLDLREVDSMDSTGLRLLISLRNAAKRDGHGLTIVPGPWQVQRIFELTATHGLFDWRD